MVLGVIPNNLGTLFGRDNETIAYIIVHVIQRKPTILSTKHKNGANEDSTGIRKKANNYSKQPLVKHRNVKTSRIQKTIAVDPTVKVEEAGLVELRSKFRGVHFRHQLSSSQPDSQHQLTAVYHFS